MRTSDSRTLTWFAALAALVSVSAGACVNAQSAAVGADASASASPSSAPPAPSASAAPPPLGPGADVAGLRKLLACPASGGTGPCKVLGTMSTCAPWNPVSPAGDGRYIGRGWMVKDATTAEQFTILRARTVPASDVPSWQLPVRISLGEIPKDAGPAFAQAERAVNAFERHDVPPAKNAAIDYLKQRTEWKDDSKAVRTNASMVQTFSDRPTYLCQGAQHEVVLVQQGFGSVGKSADGLYAELWPATW